MKKLLTILAIFGIALYACNDPKDPPDDGMKATIQAHADSLSKIDSLQKVN